MWYGIFRTIFLVILKLCFRFKVEGEENLPRKSNFILAANHNSFMDGVVLGAAIPQRVYWIILRQLFAVGPLRWFFRRIDALASGTASEKAIALLMQDKNVGVFPEGGISRNGELREFRRGAALLAIKTGRPIVPCAILGTFQALPFGRWFPRFAPIKVKIGKPHYLLKDFSDIVDDIEMQEGMNRIRNSIKELINAG
jgi:1-acyl-sn-glycerol-3-phosphate acyltransferase